MFSCVYMKKGLRGNTDECQLSAAALRTASRGRRRREEVLQNFFFSLKRFWSSSVRFSEEGRRTRRIKKTQGDITVSKSLFPALFLSPHMRGKQDARVCLCPVYLVPSQTERTYITRGDEL